jgi:hypothetical protein
VKWAHALGDDHDSKGWLEAETPVGQFVVQETRLGFAASWWPNFARLVSAPVNIGYYRTQGASKAACKRFAKSMAAAFKAMGKAGWQ